MAYLAGRLRAGELVAVPTETVYGLAANTFDAKACARIFKVKKRPRTDPLIIHIHSLDQMSTLADENEAAQCVARAFWPGPLTIVLPKKAAVPDVVTAGKPNVAIRMPSHPVFRRLLKKAGVPLAAPSANPFGYISPTTATHVRDGLAGRIRHILDGGPARIGVESTILDLRDPARPTLLRPGPITAAQLERVLGVRVKSRRGRAAKAKSAQIAPGMLARHYSPHTQVILHEKIRELTPKTEAFVLLQKPKGRRVPNVFWLDTRGSLAGIARRLFATLRQVDRMGFARIHVERARGEGLAGAINDRLERAAAG